MDILNNWTVKIIISSSILFFSCGNNQNTEAKIKTDWEDLKLHGKVKSVATFTYNAIGTFEEAQKEDKLVSKLTILFNEDGNIIETSDESFGILRGQSTYKYNDSKQKIEELDIYFGKGSNLIFKDVYSYDKYGNLIEEKTLSSNNETVSIDLYKYDKTNNLIQKKELNSNNNLERKETFKYDQKNVLMESNQFGSDEKLFNRSEYRHDKNGNLIDHSWFTPSGELMGKISREYDFSGNETKSSHMQKDGSYLSKYKYRYRRDDKGNWIEKVSFNLDRPYGIEERVIEYY